MKIRVKTLAAGPDGVTQPGTLRRVSDAEGQALIAAGHAEQVPDTTPMRDDAAVALETATAEPAPETATTRRGGAPAFRVRRGVIKAAEADDEKSADDE